MTHKGVVSTALGLPGVPTAAENIMVERARAWPSVSGRDLVRDVTCEQPYDWQEMPTAFALTERQIGVTPFIVAYDYGIKRNILRRFIDWGCRVKVVPASLPVETVEIREILGETAKVR